MNYAKGSIVKFEPTERGQRRAAALAAEYPSAAVVVPKTPHHVELLQDFEFRPVPTKKARGARSQHSADAQE